MDEVFAGLGGYPVGHSLLDLGQGGRGPWLERTSRERVSLDWAMTQMNLGNALQTLGQRES